MTPCRAVISGLGASAGGLTIGGAITRRPDLFAVALPSVPVVDLLRMEFTKYGPGNIPEFGTVKDPNDFRTMLGVSPYEHIAKETPYPAVMVSTSINDISVPPWQPAKFVARLQAATASGKPVLLRVDWGSGHFGGTTTGDQESQLADSYSFVLWQTGVAGFQPRGAATDPVTGKWGTDGLTFLELKYEGESSVSGTTIWRGDGREERATIKVGNFDRQTAALKLAGETKNRDGERVQYVIEGKVEKDVIAGTYNKGEFRFTRQ